MNKELIIHVTPSEISIALLEDKLLAELHTEKSQTGFSVGDIYLGSVRKIMPGLNAAFVKVGHEKDAFVHYLDLGLHFVTLHKLVKTLSNRNNKKSIRFETLKIEPPIGKSGKLSDHLDFNQPILVQIAKEAISTKGPRLTSDISLAGRHVVLLPLQSKISISQKIRSNEEKKRLKKIVTGVLPKNYGVIVRTAAMGKSQEEIEQDINSLVQRWNTALSRIRTEEPPALLLGEMNRTTTLIRDLLNGTFTSIAINDKTTYEECRNYIRTIAPEKAKIVKLYKGTAPIFDHFEVSKQIKSLFTKYISLKKGSYLIMERTEALHVIDVNSGARAKVEDDQEQTAMEVNMMAAEEIARQLRLRDIGGIIVIDFIDLHKGDNRTLLHERMKALMANDRAKHTVLPISKFGLMQITRQRVRPATEPEVKETCPTCHGTGEILPSVLLDEQIENQIVYFTSERGMKYLKLKVSPFVAAYLKRGIISLRMRWAMKYRCTIRIVSDQSIGIVETKFFDKEERELR